MSSMSYRVFRSSTADGMSQDPQEKFVFEPALDSDDLFDALRAAFPHIKTHSERKMQAVLDFLIQEREEDMMTVQRMAADSTSNTSIPYLNLETEVAPLNEISFDDMQLFDTPTTFTDSLSWSSCSPRTSPAGFQGSKFGSCATGTASAAPVATASSSSSSQLSIHVWDSSTSKPVKVPKRRCMTEQEKIEYRQRRALGSCDTCRQRRRKCRHFQSEPNGSNKRSKQRRSDTVSPGVPASSGSSTNISTPSVPSTSDLIDAPVLQTSLDSPFSDLDFPTEIFTTDPFESFTLATEYYPGSFLEPSLEPSSFSIPPSDSSHTNRTNPTDRITRTHVITPTSALTSVATEPCLENPPKATSSIPDPPWPVSTIGYPVHNVDFLRREWELQEWLLSSTPASERHGDESTSSTETGHGQERPLSVRRRGSSVKVVPTYSIPLSSRSRRRSSSLIDRFWPSFEPQSCAFDYPQWSKNSTPMRNGDRKYRVSSGGRILEEDRGSTPVFMSKPFQLSSAIGQAGPNDDDWSSSLRRAVNRGDAVSECSGSPHPLRFRRRISLSAKRPKRQDNVFSDIKSVLSLFSPNTPASHSTSRQLGSSTDDLMVSRVNIGNHRTSAPEQEFSSHEVNAYSIALFILAQHKLSTFFTAYNSVLCAYYNAASHLRRNHFHPRERVRPTMLPLVP